MFSLIRIPCVVMAVVLRPGVERYGIFLQPASRNLLCILACGDDTVDGENVNSVLRG